MTITKKYISIGALVGVALFLLIFGQSLIEVVDAREFVVIQHLNGSMEVVTSPGPVMQWGGDVTVYPRRDIYEFEGIKIRFSEGGEADVFGSVQFDYPLDRESILKIHSKYGSPEVVKEQIIDVSTKNGIKFSGPLMSSFDSYAAKRNDLIGYFENQTEFGVYATRTQDTLIEDPLTGKPKTISIVEILTDENGRPKRQQESVVGQYNFDTDAFKIERIKYTEQVENQIIAQQERIMEVQTAIAEAKKAEQNVKTVEAQGKAKAAEAKWAQEIIKAKEVTLAQQKLEVATLDRKTAEQFKQAEILRGQGESERKRLNMEADGALNPKLDALVKIAEINADAIKNTKSNLVPNTVIGSQSGVGNNPVIDLINMLNIKAAKDLSVDFELSGKTTQKP